MRSAFLLLAALVASSVVPASADLLSTTTTFKVTTTTKTTTTSTTFPKPTTTTSLKPTTTTSSTTTSSTTETTTTSTATTTTSTTETTTSTTEVTTTSTTTTSSTTSTSSTTTSSTTTTTTLLGGCRVTGGGIVDVTFPPVVDATHGGQVGAPLGVVTAFSPNTPCIQGEWQHVRHDQPRVFGNFHSDTFDSLLCGCLPCAENPESPGTVGDLCNPGDRICGPEPRRAPANKICFTGVGDFTVTNGSKNPRSVAFRVDVEDRSEPGGAGGPPPPDRYRLRLWDLTGDADSGANLVLREQISCGESLAEEPLLAPVPDIDDGGELAKGNHQIHPEINHKDCP